MKATVSDVSCLLFTFSNALANSAMGRADGCKISGHYLGEDVKMLVTWSR